MEESTRKWMNDYYEGLAFALNKGVLDIPLKLEMLDLYQLGEIGLSDGGKVYEHKQMFWEISYVISGEGYFIVDGERFKVKKGDLHIVKPGTTHTIEAEKYNNFRFSYIAFKLSENLDREKYASLFEFYNNPPKGPLKDIKNIHRALDSMVEELYFEHEYSAEIFNACATQFLISVYKLCRENSYETGDSSPNRISGGIAYDIMRHIDMKIADIKNVSALASKLGYTPDYLTKLFKSKTGKSIQQYMQEKKIDYGTQLLTSGKYSIKDVAATLNYESTQAFSKMFKKHTGFTPSEYIKNNKG